MGRYRFGQIVFLLFSMGSFCAQANCLLAEKFRQENKQELANIALNSCAMSNNDDESQMILAESYMQGTNGLEKDEKEALYMYQLASENGNAEAQVKLAELLLSFDTSPERRQELGKYQKGLKKTSSDSEGYMGEIYHPYTLLLLASERPENKWYYPSQNRSAPPRTATLLSRYEITPEKKQLSLKEASRWKTRKLLEVAKEILPSDEYPEFEGRLRNSSTRTQAMSELKERLMNYVNKKQQERSKPL